MIVIQTLLNTQLTRAVGPRNLHGHRVAHQADASTRTHTGWNVVVTGPARRVADPAPVNRMRVLHRVEMSPPCSRPEFMHFS